MKNILKIIFLLLFAAALLTACAQAPSDISSGEGDIIGIQILATSDIHGKMLPYDYILDEENSEGSLAQISTLIKELRTENTILVDNGDAIQGNSAELFLEDDIHPMVAGFNLAGYDIWTAGNHEFNFGIDTLQRIAAGFDQTFLCGNVYLPDGTPLAQGYTIIEKSGVKIGFIGMVSPNILLWDALNLEGCTVTDPVEETKRIIAQIEDETDILVAVQHMGEKNEYGVKNSGVNDLANACPQLDAIIAAHDHKQIAGTEVNGVLIVENANMGRSLAQIVFTVEKTDNGRFEIKERTSESYTIQGLPADAELTAALAGADARAKEAAQSIIGVLENGPLVPGEISEGVPAARLEETPFVNLINEVQLYYSGADISAAAYYIDDANVLSGPIKKSDIALIYKYTNTLYKLEMNGAQLKKWMEWSAAYYAAPKEGDTAVFADPQKKGYDYDMFSGVRYEINISREPGQRIEKLTFMDGTPVKDDDVFTVAINSHRGASHLLEYGEIYREGEDELPLLLDPDIRSELGGISGMILDYIVNVNGGVLEVPSLTGNWKITGREGSV